MSVKKTVVKKLPKKGREKKESTSAKKDKKPEENEISEKIVVDEEDKKPEKEVSVEIEKDNEEQEEAEKAARKDPYLLEERDAIINEIGKKWLNKQRVLVFATRGINTAHRHLMEDVKKMLPHSRGEVKWEKSLPFDEIAETAEMNNCNNVIFLEARKKTHLYMYMAKCPAGPTVKLKVQNIHTMDSRRFVGNHLLGSRPLLVFDKLFNEDPLLKMMKEMLLQMWGTPRYHPKSKPFHDHVMAFQIHDNRIWFRHYQIFSPKFSSRLSDQTLREVGPQFALIPLRAFEGAFTGKTIWKNELLEAESAKKRRVVGKAKSKGDSDVDEDDSE